MKIRKASWHDAETAARFMRLAILDIAEVLTGEFEEERILEVLASFFKQKRNRLSYENCFICEMDKTVVGLILGYFGGNAEELDKPILNRLKRVKHNEALIIEKEADQEDFYIDTLCVDSRYRSQGIGSALIQCMEQFAKENGYSRISLVVEEHNLRAKSLYTKLGYHFLKKIFIHHHQYEYRVKILQQKTS